MSDALVEMLLPPTGLALLALLLQLTGRRRGAAGALAAVVLFATAVAVRGLYAGLPPPLAETGAAPGAIVILAGDPLEPADRLGTAPSGNTLERLRTGAALGRRTALPILVTSGRAPHGQARQAQAMADSLRNDFQIRVRWTDAGSRDLWQSASNSAALLRKDGVSSVFLVADRWDLRLAALAFDRVGIVVTPAPVLRPLAFDWDLAAFTPHSPAWIDTATAVRQWAGIACSAVSWCEPLMHRREVPGEPE